MSTEAAADAATVVRTPGTHVLDLGDRQVHLQVSLGEGTPIVLLGGCGVPSYAFRTVIERLPGRWVVALDRPGLVETAWPGELPTLAEEVATLAALGAAVGEPVVLVAHSMAGPHAEAFARLHPELVRGLVLLDASIEIDAKPPHALVDRAWLKASEVTYESARIAPVAAVGSIAAAGMIWAQSQRLHLTNARPPRARALFKRPDTLASVVAEQAAYASQLADLEQLLETTRWPGTPSIVMTAGTRAGWVKKQAVLTDRVHGRQVVVEDSRHLIMVDRPDLVADAVLSLVGPVSGEGELRE